MKEMLKYLKPYWKGLIGATAAMALSTVCDLLLPTIMSEILNNGVYAMDFSYIVKCCAVMLAVAVLGLGTYLTEQSIPFELRVLTGKGVQSFPVASEQELQKSIDSLLCTEGAKEGSIQDRFFPASWQYHIGGGEDEA